MKNIIILGAILFIVSCKTTRIINYNERTYSVKASSEEEARAIAKDYYEAEERRAAILAQQRAERTATAIAAEAARVKAEQEALKAKEAERQKNIEECNKELADTKCYKDKWTTYEFGEYFNRYSKENKITPYKVVFGSSYERRNISSFVVSEILDNYLKVAAFHLPESCRTIAGDGKELEAEHFNKFIAKWDVCYKKLK
jgi:flagellar biosynthesis GTPase FlhF